MPMSVFISHVYEDLRSRDTIRDWCRRGLLGAGVVITGESEDDRRHLGAAAIKGPIKLKIDGAGAVLVLVGDDTHNHTWVDYEVNHALSAHKRVVPVRLPNTRGAGPASVRGLALVPFDPNSLQAALR